MAKKEEKKAKVILERVYTIPLRKEFLKVAKYRRAKKAITATRSFLQKHMKSENVKLGKFLNLILWKDGIKNPPHHVKVNATKTEDGIVKAELFGAPVEKPKESKKEAKGKKEAPPMTEKEKKEEKIEEKAKEIKEKKAESAKEIEKEEIKELKEERQQVPPEAKSPKEPGHKQDHAIKAPKSEQHISRDEHQLKGTK